MKCASERGRRVARRPRGTRRNKPARQFCVEDSVSHWLEPRALLALTVTSYAIPLVQVVQPAGIALGSDGNLWFTESAAGAIGRMMVGGAISQYPLPDVPPPAGSPAGTASTPIQPEAITAGPDGALWFTTTNSMIGRISTNGAITEYRIAGLTAFTSAITTGADGALWFTGVAGKVGRITTAGVVTEFSVNAPPPPGSAPGTASTPATPTGITAGPDGALWFAGVPGYVGRITTSGSVTEFAVPDPPASALAAGVTLTPSAITAGPDGALWFTTSNSTIGRIATSGAVTEYSVSGLNAAAATIVASPDGALWFTGIAGQVSQITTNGEVSELAVPGNFNQIAGLTTGPDGSLWFTEAEDGTTAGQQPAIGEITAAAAIRTFAIPQGTTLDPSHGVDVDPGSITTGPDGALWFTENGAIGRIATDGTIEQFPLTTPGANPDEITSGPDGALWFSQAVTDSYDTTWSIGRITTSGTITTYRLPAGSSLADITAAQGKIWFTDSHNNPDTFVSTSKIGWITPNGKIKTFAIPGKDGREGFLNGITTGPNGQVWFAEGDGVKGKLNTASVVGTVTARGHFRMFQFVETGGSGSYAPGTPSDLIDGPGGKIWFLDTMHARSGIAQISTGGRLGDTIAATAQDLVSLPDGQIWFESGNGLGLATRSGIVVSQDLPGISVGKPYGGGTGNSLTLGPDGASGRPTGPRASFGSAGWAPLQAAWTVAAATRASFTSTMIIRRLSPSSHARRLRAWPPQGRK